MSTACITGGAGFIGSHLARFLLQEGHTVKVLDNLTTGSLANLQDLDVEFFEGDIREQAEVAAAVRGCDWVFHHAAMISVPQSMLDPFGCYDINLTGSLNVLWAAQQAGVQKMVLASSSAVYGEVSGQVDEQAALQPQSPYAASKLAMEQAAEMFTRVYGLDTICLRYFNVYGPRQSPDSPYAAVIPLFMRALLSGQSATVFGDGLQTRNFVHVQDVARANLLAASRPAAGQSFNIAGGSKVTVLDLITILSEFIPAAPAPTFVAERPGDIRHSDADIRLAGQALGYRPEIALKGGIENTLQWFHQ